MQRIKYIDFLKGIHLGLVFAGNITQMNGTFWMIPQFIPMGELSYWDNIYAKIIHLTCVPELNYMFVFILGHNTYFFLKNRHEFSTHLKRCLILMILGIIHAAFFYWGDVLFIFGLCTIPLFFSIRQREKIIFMQIFLLAVVSISMTVYLEYFHIETGSYNFDTSYHTKFGTLPFWDLVELRFKDFLLFNFGNLVDLSSTKYTLITILSYIKIYFLLLLGVISAKRKWLINYSPNWNQTIFVVIVFTIGQWVKYSFPEFNKSIDIFRQVFNIYLGVYLFGLMYEVIKGSSVDKTLRASGKNSLSLYIGGNILGAWILSAYGLGLYQKVGPSLLWNWGAVVFILMAILSLKVGYFPLERLWRRLVYKS